MKTLQRNFTTPEQSKRLLELGVPADSADMRYVTKFDIAPCVNIGFFCTNDDISTPCWSVGRLIEIHLKCCTTLNQNDAHIVISRFGIETGGLLQNMYDMICECALLGKYDFSKLEE